MQAQLSMAPAAGDAMVVLAEDVVINGVLAAHAPLALSTWRGRTGLSELPPLGRPFNRRAWACRVRIEPAGLSAYAKAVHAATDTYLASMSNASENDASCVLRGLLLRLSG